MPAVTPGQGGTHAPRVLVTVGTDHHPFDRLIDWVNDWLASHPDQVGDFYVQWGAAATQPACPGTAFLRVDELDALLDAASVVVCHGGPGSIAGAWDRGRVPVVVPRLRELGEIVDGHQVDFCRKLAALDRVRLAQTPAEFAAVLGGALSEPGPHAGAPPTGAPPAGALAPQSCHAAEVQAAVAQFAALVDGLVRQPRRRLPLPRRLVPLPRRTVPQPREGTAPRGIETHAGRPAARGAPPALIPEQPASWEAGRPAARFALTREPSKEQ
jgi:UDP-N-acetylglucosamine transferase subunit ALG13